MMKPARARRIRGWILLFLGESKGILGERLPLTGEVIVTLLDSAGERGLSVEELRAECEYLREKALVELSTFKGLAAKIAPGWHAQITARGVDLVEGSIRENGIELPRAYQEDAEIG